MPVSIKSGEGCPVIDKIMTLDVRQARAEMGLTQEVVAKQLRIPLERLKEIECNKCGTIMRLCIDLNLSPYLLARYFEPARSLITE